MQTLISARPRLEDYLRERGVDYQLEHHPQAFTARGVAASEHIVAQRVAKTVMVKADGELLMVVVPASHVVDLPAVAKAAAAHHVRLADEAEFAPAFPDCEVGAMPPFGNLYGMPVYVDIRLSEYQTIRFEAGTYTDTICMRYTDYVALVNPTVSSFARLPD